MTCKFFIRVNKAPRSHPHPPIAPRAFKCFDANGRHCYFVLVLGSTVRSGASQIICRCALLRTLQYLFDKHAVLFPCFFHLTSLFYFSTVSPARMIHPQSHCFRSHYHDFFFVPHLLCNVRSVNASRPPRAALAGACSFVSRPILMCHSLLPITNELAGIHAVSSLQVPVSWR